MSWDHGWLHDRSMSRGGSARRGRTPAARAVDLVVAAASRPRWPPRCELLAWWSRVIARTGGVACRGRLRSSHVGPVATSAASATTSARSSPIAAACSSSTRACSAITASRAAHDAQPGAEGGRTAITGHHHRRPAVINTTRQADPRKIDLCPTSPTCHCGPVPLSTDGEIVHSVGTLPKLPRCFEGILNSTSVASSEVSDNHHVLDVRVGTLKAPGNCRSIESR
jgi:hypothetical protein